MTCRTGTLLRLTTGISRYGDVQCSVYRHHAHIEFFPHNLDPNNLMDWIDPLEYEGPTLADALLAALEHHWARQ